MSDEILQLGDTVKIPHLGVLGKIVTIKISAYAMPMYEIEYISAARDIRYVALYRHHMKLQKIYGRKNNIIKLKNKKEV